MTLVRANDRANRDILRRFNLDTRLRDSRADSGGIEGIWVWNSFSGRRWRNFGGCWAGLWVWFDDVWDDVGDIGYVFFEYLFREVDVDRGSSSGGWVHGLSGDAGRQGCREPSED
jgi:hypothetical protein